ncbi:MAG: hypothetical protein RIR57_814, partial [Bacteroidota bacterium]
PREVGMEMGFNELIKKPQTFDRSEAFCF